MRKLKLAIVLPVVQAIVAAALLYMAGPLRGPPVPTARLISVGLNVPARFLEFFLMDPFSGLVPVTTFGMDTTDLFFLAGVIVVWYLVGRALDRMAAPNTATRPEPIVVATIHGFLLALGGFLFFIGLLDFQDPYFDNLGHRPERGILTLAWSVSLIFFSGRTLVRMIRRWRIGGLET